MKTVPFPNQKEIEEQAASWIAAIDRGLDATEERYLGEWLEASPLHGEMLVKCASMWDLLDVLQPIAKLMPIDQTLAPSQSPSKPHQTGDSLVAANDRVWLKPAMVAASVLMLVSIMVFLKLPDSSTPLANTQIVSPSTTQQGQNTTKIYRAAVGEVSIVPLSDGSVLELNTDSVVAVRFTKTQRNIELIQGEVYFDVAKDASKPFVVKVGEDEVTAIGTAFSVDAGDLQKEQHSVDEVIVTEGKVRVKRRNSQTPIYLVTGQKVTARDDVLQVSNGADSGSLLAWREGVVVFEGESLTEVIREIDRYTPLKFRIADKELASISVGGFFKTGNLDQLLLVLENNFGVVSQKIGDEIILSKAN
jgi:transmembrane sensor